MSPPQQLRQQTSNCSSLLIHRPRKDERLSWPSWLTYSGWLTHISGHPLATSRAQDSESTLAKDQCSTAGPRHQPVLVAMRPSNNNSASAARKVMDALLFLCDGRSQDFRFVVEDLEFLTDLGRLLRARLDHTHALVALVLDDVIELSELLQPDVSQPISSTQRQTETDRHTNNNNKHLSTSVIAPCSQSRRIASYSRHKRTRQTDRETDRQLNTRNTSNNQTTSELNVKAHYTKHQTR